MKKIESEEEATKKEVKKDTTQVNDQLEQCRKECADWKDKCLRATADFQNYKKRIEKEKSIWITTGKLKIISDLLSIIDDLDRALVQIPEDQKGKDSWARGFELIFASLQKLLETYGVTQMKNYQTFDPEFHEALVQIDSPDHQSGEIVEVLQKGFLIDGKLLRPAKVSVAK